MAHTFRTQSVVRAFAFGAAFASAIALAGCAADGSVKPSTQSQLVSACDKAQSAVTIAGFFTDKMTATEAKAYNVAKDATDEFCSPSALAADLTPAAVAANAAALGKVVSDMQTMTDSQSAPVSSPVSVPAPG